MVLVFTAARFLVLACRGRLSRFFAVELVGRLFFFVVVVDRDEEDDEEEGDLRQAELFEPVAFFFVRLRSNEARGHFVDARAIPFDQ